MHHALCWPHSSIKGAFLSKDGYIRVHDHSEVNCDRKFHADPASRSRLESESKSSERSARVRYEISARFGFGALQNRILLSNL
jgi:hypothetical protein